MILKFKKLNPDAMIPKHSREGDAAMDIFSAEEMAIKPGERVLVHTDVAIEISNGWCGLVLPRSGNAINKGVTVMNSPGLIDSNYRGEIMIGLINTDKQNSFIIQKGDRIAQLLITRALSTSEIQVEVTNELSASNRGTQGFGSSGR